MTKSLSLLLSAALFAGSISTAQADWGYRRGYYSPPPMHHHHHRERNDWIGPAAILAITGLAIGAAAYNSNHYEPPAPSYGPQPVYAPPAPASNPWYYCRSSAQYYPYTNVCPEGWMAVPVR